MRMGEFQDMHTIDVGAQVPRWGNAFLQGFGRAVLRLMGWRVDARLPDLPKFVLIGIPHTSNWDFVVGICTVFLLRLRVRWWVKHTVAVWPFAGIVDWLGGVPINRRAAHGVVEQTVAVFRREPQFVLGVTPEGTRGLTSGWKRGFYHVAVAANVPIVLAAFDYERKVLSVGGIVHPTGDYAADTARMLEWFAPRAQARKPELYSGTA